MKRSVIKVIANQIETWRGYPRSVAVPLAERMFSALEREGYIVTTKRIRPKKKLTPRGGVHETFT